MDLPNLIDDRSERFRDAWDLVDKAKDSARNLANSWNLLVDTEYLFETSVYVDDEGEGRLHVYVDDSNQSELDSFEHGSRHFIQLLLLAGGKALATAAQCVSGAFSTSDEDQLEFLPLCKEPHDFKSLVDSGLFSGFRPDQIQLLEQFQPYEALPGDNAALSHLRRYTLHLYGLFDVERAISMKSDLRRPAVRGCNESVSAWRSSRGCGTRMPSVSPS